MKKISFLILCAFFLSCASLMNPQPEKVTTRYFPDPEININTPAFHKKKGFTTYAEMMNFLNGLEKNHRDIMKITFIGTSQKGKPIPMIKLERKNGTENKLKVWLQACIHGDEPASTEGILFLIDKLTNDPSYSKFLDRLNISIVPMANIDGSEIQTRVAANGLDLNRDQTKLSAPESNILKKAFSDSNADVAVDFHEYQPYRRDYLQLGEKFGTAGIYDVMLMYSSNLNIPKNLREYTKSRFVNAIEVALDKENLTHHDYFTSDKERGDIIIHQGSTNARSSATSYALSNAISGLIEVRGGDLGRTSYKRRVYSIFLVAASYLQTAYENVDEVKEEIKKAMENPNPKVVVKSKSPVNLQNLKMLDLSSGKETEIEVKLSDASKIKPLLSRQRPNAYILLPSQQLIVEKLKVLGLNVENMKEEKEMEVENYTIAEYEKDVEKFEGVFRQKVNVNLSKVKRKFPAGSYIVYLNQRKSNLAVEVLEPDAPNSFVSFSVLTVKLNQELPIYRYLSEEKIN